MIGFNYETLMISKDTLYKMQRVSFLIVSRPSLYMTRPLLYGHPKTTDADNMVRVLVVLHDQAVVVWAPETTDADNMVRALGIKNKSAKPRPTTVNMRMDFLDFSHS